MILADGVIQSNTLLAFVLGGSLLTTLAGGYRFLVNMRTTERGMARQRVAEADEDRSSERAARQRAQREAELWRSYAGDLIYELRQRAESNVPVMPAELQQIIAPPSDTALSRRRSGRRKPPDFDAPLRRFQRDAASIERHHEGDWEADRDRDSEGSEGSGEGDEDENGDEDR